MEHLEGQRVTLHTTSGATYHGLLVNLNDAHVRLTVQEGTSWIVAWSIITSAKIGDELHEQ